MDCLRDGVTPTSEIEARRPQQAPRIVKRLAAKAAPVLVANSRRLDEAPAHPHDLENALNLACLGACAGKPAFHVIIEKALDANGGEANLYLQVITRVLRKLISNSFGATSRRRETERPDYPPTPRAPRGCLANRLRSAYATTKHAFRNNLGRPHRIHRNFAQRGSRIMSQRAIA